MPVQSGDRAPDFVVPAVQEDRTICLADYRGETPVLLGLFRGLYCPFCRRALAQMAATSDQLQPLGVDSLAIVGTELDNARSTSSSGPRAGARRRSTSDDASLVWRAAAGADARTDAGGQNTCTSIPRENSRSRFQ